MSSFGLRGLTQKLSFIKDFSSLAVPIIITFIAVLILGVTVLLGNTLKKTVEKGSISQLSNSIKSLSRNPISNGQAGVEEKYQLDYLNDANYIELLSVQTTQRALLSYKIFPSPKDLSYLIFEEFGERFCEGIEKQLVQIKAVDCPTDAEIDKHLEMSGFLGRSGFSYAGRRSYGGTMGEVVSTIQQAVCEDKALSTFVYCNPVDISGYEFWGQYQYFGATQAVEDCWYWQLAYWVIEDVLSTIGKLNSGSASVLTSPVKRLLEISFVAGSGGSYGLRSGAGSRPTASYTAGKVRPGYILSTQGLSIRPYTKRICNEDIDVTHFNLSVVVSSKAVPLFMRELCSGKEHRFKSFHGDKEEQVFKHNQITILESVVLPVLQESKSCKAGIGMRIYF
ncbi:MAG: hypothetical protein ACYSSL_09870 [Planctomycetota bacterium]|jgi:hypothetical protein